MDYLKLIRAKHYLKNVLVFVPLFFNRDIFAGEKIISSILGFVSFCLISSAVYILNDLMDAEKDKKHPKKKNRPIASGRISKAKATIIGVVFVALAVVISVFSLGNRGVVYILAYAILNVIYSVGMKNYPIIDVVILASGFVLRVLYGASITDVMISKWLYLVIVSGSLFMGLGKRRNELKQQGDNSTREVLKYYNEAFLDKNMYVTLGLVNVFYALWTMEAVNEIMIWTVPWVMIIMMRYSYDIEGRSDGDPIDVLTHDKILLFLVICYTICMAFMLYMV